MKIIFNFGYAIMQNTKTNYYESIPLQPNFNSS